MTTIPSRGSRLDRRARRTSSAAPRALLALCVLGALAALHLLASAGCSSGAICYRNTDCPYASDCKQGQCVRRVSNDAAAGASGTESDDAGESDASQTPDAN